MTVSTDEIHIEEKYQSILETEGDPAYRHRWVRKDKVEIRKHQGWEIVQKGDAGAPNATKSEPDGTITCNELILMRMPQQVYQRRMLSKAAFAEKQVQGIVAEANAAGLEDFIDRRTVGFGKRR